MTLIEYIRSRRRPTAASTRIAGEGGFTANAGVRSGQESLRFFLIVLSLLTGLTTAVALKWAPFSWNLIAIVVVVGSFIYLFLRNRWFRDKLIGLYNRVSNNVN